MEDCGAGECLSPDAVESLKHIAAAPTLLHDRGYQGDGLLVDVCFWGMLVLCCGVYLIANVPAPSINNNQYPLS